MNRRGFTIVELIIVITIMGILLVLGVVNLRDSQANGRDTERKTDIETIALHLETYYKNGNGTTGTNILGYPSTLLTTNVTQASIAAFLPDMDVQSITAPGITDPATTFIAATCIPSLACPQTPDSVTPKPTTDQYVYQPLQSDGTLCTTALQECRKFNLYYALETATADCPAPNNICMITSKNQ